MKKSVGLLLMVRMADGGIRAILQRRGWWNHETEKEESWRGSYQPTAHGGMEQNEIIDVAIILREVAEEIGEVVALQLAISIANENKLELLAETRNDEVWVTTYGIIMPMEIIGKIRLGPSSGGIRPISTDEVRSIQSIEAGGYRKDDTLPENRVIVMFDHNIRAVKQAFTVFM